MTFVDFQSKKFPPLPAEVLKGWILEYFKNPSAKPSYERGVFLEDGGTLRDSTVPKLGEQECVNNPFPLHIFGVSNVSAYVCVPFSDVVASLKLT